EPAFRGDVTVAGIEPEQQFLRAFLGCGSKPLRIFEGSGPNDDAVEMQLVKGFVERVVVANAASQLTGNRQTRHYASDDRAVLRSARFGSVEIDQVQSRRSRLGPSLGARDRIFAKDRLGRVVSLPKADTLSAADVDRGNDLNQ